MNQTFSFQRWALLVGKHFAENKKRYLLSVLAFIGLLSVWFVFVISTDRHDPLAAGLQYTTFYFCLFLIGPFYASQFFKDLGSRVKGINYLLMPASSFEKLLCSLFYVFVLFPLVFTAAFYLTDFIIVSIAKVSHPSYNGIRPSFRNGIPVRAQVTNIFNIDEGREQNIAFYFWLFFLAIQSAALLGSVYFPKYSYIKTAISLALLFIVCMLIGEYILQPIAPHPGGFHEGLNAYKVYKGGSSNEVAFIQLPGFVATVLKYLLYYSSPLVFWWATYYRLKEKEV